MLISHRFKRYLTLLIPIALLSSVTSSFANADLGIDSIIVKFKNQYSTKNLSQQGINNLLSNKLNLDLKLSNKLSNGAFVFKINQTINNTTLDTKLEELNKDPAIKYASADSYFYMQKTPQASRYAEQWHYFEPEGGINLPDAWESTNGKDVVVAVVDTGIVKHQDLADQLLPGQNFVDDGNKNNDPTDHGGQTSYHGTHVAGTIAANGEADNTVIGVAPGAKILPARVLGKKGAGKMSGIIEGMRWSAGIGKNENPNPAKILNLSLSGVAKCEAIMQETIDELYNKGIIVVVAAGNSNMPAKLFSPANCKKVITVGATDRTGKKASYSNYGSDILTIAAPGGNVDGSETNGVLSLGGIGKYQFLDGTSMAAPHISGLIALMLSANPKLPYEQIVKYLKQGAKNDTMGVGLADASKTLTIVEKNYTPKDENEEPKKQGKKRRKI